ncbi:Hypothetical predicted protein [Mytilus galloprovincialis]|uniref:Uncharacterized protein n=1 Tax=Mytilus galloprovincialis TaxID=29158 RepID=A0A8B6DIG5_MYTGA|nr:Hypothetical predicted protein [Mytilus galloprovincialis]
MSIRVKPLEERVTKKAGGNGRDIVKQSHSESQKHWASRSGIRIKSFPKTIKPTIPIYTATPIPIAPNPLAPLETSTIISSASSIDSYSRLLLSNMPCLSMPTFSNYSVAQTASPYCPPVDSSRESTTVTKFVIESPVASCILNMETPTESSMPVPPLDQFQFDLEDNLECGSWKSSCLGIISIYWS